MKKLVFNSQILKNTDRYSADFALPDFLYDENGMLDRQKTIDVMLGEVYGYVNTDGISVSVVCTAVNTQDVYAGKCKCHKRLVFTLSRGENGASFPVDLFIPNTDKDHPLVVALDFDLNVSKCYCPLEEILEQDIAVAHILYTDVTSDDKDFSNGIARLLCDRRDPHTAGKLAVWAYAASTVGAYMLDNGYVKEGDLFVSGHSRLGKTALLAAALDTRFAGAHSNNSGCTGVSVSREKEGESVNIITDWFPHWFAPNYRKYANKENEMPFDQHYLTALVAPRLLSVATAEDDTWADTYAQYLSLEAASVIYEKHGVVGLDSSMGLMKTGMSSDKGQIGLTMRKGPHYFSRDDWNFFIKFIKSKRA